MNGLSLSDILIKKILPSCIRAGISYNDFFSYTLEDIRIILEAYQESQKELIKSKQSELYASSVLVSCFVGRVLMGKELPSYEAVFNSHENSENDFILMKERLLDFASKANASRKE